MECCGSMNKENNTDWDEFTDGIIVNMDVLVKLLRVKLKRVF